MSLVSWNHFRLNLSLLRTCLVPRRRHCGLSASMVAGRHMSVVDEGRLRMHLTGKVHQSEEAAGFSGGQLTTQVVRTCSLKRR